MKIVNLIKGVDTEKYKFWRHQFSDFFKCERHFMGSHFLNTNTMLDIGGSSGGLYGAIKEKYSNIYYTCLDIDNEALEYGKKLYPDAHFINSDFFDYSPGKRFDTVTYLQQFFLYPNWKETLNRLASFTEKNVFIEARFRINGGTVVDPDLSYSYYSGLKNSKWDANAKKVPWIILNAYEFLNYCLSCFPVSKFEIFGNYQNPPPPHFIPMNRDKVIAACCWITLDRENRRDGRNAIVEWEIPREN